MKVFRVCACVCLLFCLCNYSTCCPGYDNYRHVVFGRETLHPLLSQCASLGAFVTSSSALVALFPCGCTRIGPKHVWGRAVSGHGAHVTRLVWFSSAPLCVLLFILPPLLFSLLSPLSLYLLFVSLLPSEKVSVCLDIFLIPGLLHHSGSSSESHYFNSGENISAWRDCVEIPLWWQSPKSNNSTVSLGGIRFLTRSPRSRALGTGVAWLKSQLWVIMDWKGFL